MDGVRQNGRLFRVFLLEDEPALRFDIGRRIERDLPVVAVVSASNIEEALKVLSTENGFDVGILDVRLPWRAGMQPEAHPDVAERMKEKGVPCLFITAFRETEDVEKYLAERSLADPTAKVIQKRLVPGEFSGELLRQLKTLFVKLASARVTAGVRGLFGPGAASGPSSGTAALIALERDVEEYWPFLDAKTKDLVRNWFIVQESGDLVSLSLFTG